MDIFDFAMKMEKDGEEYYNSLAQESSDAGLRSIFTMLANDEVKHFETLKMMRKETEPEMPETLILLNAKNIFGRMKEAGVKSAFRSTPKDLLEKAQEIERKSQEYYLKIADVVLNPRHKDLLLCLAEEEKKHYFLLENIIEFLSRPKQWIENAEFHHLDEY